MTIQAMQARLQALRDLAGQLDTTIVDKEAKDHFLRSAWSALRDAQYALSEGQKTPNPDEASMWFERIELQLHIAENHLENAQDGVSKGREAGGD
jgi:hypothetical protein